MTDEALATRARDAGLLVEWEDATGIPRTVSPDTLRAALDALGLSSTDDRAPVEAPPLITADVGQPIAFPDRRGTARLMLERGDARDIAPEDVVIIDEPGYHHIETADGVTALAVAPHRALGVADLTGRAKAWGLAAQLYSLRGTASAGFGDFAALAEWAEAAAMRAADALAISPVHALFLADPGRFSPYSPSTRDFLNPLYADPCTGQEPDSGALIDWRTAAPRRIARLRAAFAGFGGDPAFDAFVRDGGERLRSHAMFEALHGHFTAAGRPGGWQAWSAAFQVPDNAEVRAFADAHADDVRFHMFAQWRADQSLANAHAAAKRGGMAIGLVTDLAVGLDPGGSHAWSHRDELLHGLTLGAPPDAFQSAGQGWGITGLSPTALQRTGFAPFLRTIRAALAHAGGIRIDHALGLGRLWVIPEGASPLDGVYLRQPIDDLLRLLALESQRAGALIVAEDLGVVPPGIRDRLVDRHLLGMRVLPFERDAQGGFTDPAGWTGEAVAMTSTHDLTPIAGWWRGTDIGWRERLGFAGDDLRQREVDRRRFWRAAGEGPQPPATAPAAAVDAAVTQVARAACELAIVALEDVLGLEEAPNLPGTIEQHPNWRRRLPATAETLFAEPAVSRRLDRLATERPR